MADYIDKNDLREYISGYIKSCNGKPIYTDIDALLGISELLENMPAADVQPVDKDNMHIIYIGRKAYLAEITIMEFMKKMDIIRDSLAHIENYFDTYAETIQQINACRGRCTDITEVKYFIDRIKENCRYD